MKNISLFKNLDKVQKPKGQGVEDKRPDYIVSAKIGEKFEEIGAGWLKMTKPSEKFPEGRGYLSVAFKGFELKEVSGISDEQKESIKKLHEQAEAQKVTQDISVGDIPF